MTVWGYLGWTAAALAVLLTLREIARQLPPPKPRRPVTPHETRLALWVALAIIWATVISSTAYAR